MKQIITYFLYLSLSLPLMAQKQAAPCNCCSEAQRQFDFWIGNWEVYDTTGIKIGENKILVLQDHCVLQENWVSKNSTGTSYNYYNAQDKTWNQLWVDNSGNSLTLKGSFKDNKMVLRDQLRTQRDGSKSYNQITWSKHPDSTVLQSWDLMDESGKKVSTLFVGIYKKLP